MIIAKTLILFALVTIFYPTFAQKPIASNDILYNTFLRLEFSTPLSAGVRIEYSNSPTLDVLIPSGQFRPNVLSAHTTAFAPITSKSLQFLRISLAKTLNNRDFPAFLKNIKLESNEAGTVFERSFPGRGVELNARTNKRVFIGGIAIKSHPKWKQSSQFCKPHRRVTYQVLADVLFNQAMVSEFPTKGPLAFKELNRPFTPIVIGARASKRFATGTLDVPMEWIEPGRGGFTRIKLGAQYSIRMSCGKSEVEFRELFVGSNAGRFESKIRRLLTRKLEDLAEGIGKAGAVKAYGGCPTQYKLANFGSFGKRFEMEYRAAASSCA